MLTMFWSTLRLCFLAPVPGRNLYEIKVSTFCPSLFQSQVNIGSRTISDNAPMSRGRYVPQTPF